MAAKVIISSLVGVGTIGGGATGIYFFMQPKNLKEDLEKDGAKALDISGTSSDKEWEKIVAKFKDNTNPATGTYVKKINIAEDISTEPDKGLAKIKKQCEELFKKEIKNTEDYKNDKQLAKDWCTNKSPFLDK